MLRRLVRVVLALAGLLASTAVGAAAAPTGTYRSSLVFANPGAVPANVTVAFVNVAGVSTKQESFVVEPGAGHLLYVPNVAGLANGRYAVQARSDQYVSMLVNLTADDTRRSTAYNGITATGAMQGRGKTLYLPHGWADSGGFANTIAVMNAGNSTPTQVTLTFRDVDGNTIATTSGTVPPFTSALFDVAAVPNVGAGVRTATVTATDDVAAIVLTHHAAGHLGSARASTVPQPVLYLPVLYRNYFGYTTTIVAQSAAENATLVADYVASTGQSAGRATASRAVHVGVLNQGTSTILPDGFNGSAIQRSTEGRNLVAIGSIFSGGPDFELYNGVPSSLASTRATCMSILKNYHGYNTSLTVQNVGTAATSLTFAYVDAGGARVLTETLPTLAPGASFFNYTPANLGLPVGFNGAVNVGSSAAPIVGIVNELFGTGDGPGDELFTYLCDNSTPTGTPGTFFVYAPLVLQNAPIS